MGIFSRKSDHTSAVPANNSAQAPSFTASVHNMEVPPTAEAVNGTQEQGAPGDGVPPQLPPPAAEAAAPGNGVPPQLPPPAVEAGEEPNASFTKRHRLMGLLYHQHQQPPAPDGQKGGQAAKMKRQLTMCLNLRDVGAVLPNLLRGGVVFRSSQLLSASDMKAIGVRTILDLRRMDRPCKKKGKVMDQVRLAGRYTLQGSKMVMPERLKPYAGRGHPHPCEVCRQSIKQKLGFEAGQVIHADLIPTLVGLRIFQAMPNSIRFKALLAACRGQGAASVMAGAVANPQYMGYKALYKTVLEDSKRGIAKAMRVYADPEAFPVLIHCIHGKDRTGIIVMLLLLLCGVDKEVIVEDYMKSETVLKASRMHHELDLDVYLTADDVIAATRDTMEATIDYINEKHGGIVPYLQDVGMEDWELSRIRINLLQHAAPEDLLSRLSVRDARSPKARGLFGAGGLFGHSGGESAADKAMDAGEERANLERVMANTGRGSHRGRPVDRARSVEAPGPLAADREHFSAARSPVHPGQPHVSNLVSISAPPILSPETEQGSPPQTGPRLLPEPDTGAAAHDAKIGAHGAQPTRDQPPDRAGPT